MLIMCIFLCDIKFALAAQKVVGSIPREYLFIYLFIAKHLSCLEFALVSSSTIITNIKIQT